jgi:hypothetical protein
VGKNNAPKRVWPNGYRVGELLATQSGRMLRALARIVCISANYLIGMLTDLAAALAFLALGLNRFSGPWVVAGGVVIVGFMSCGCLEYVVHRWVLHGPPSVARRGHAQHHAEPRALISTPLFVIMTGALAMWGLLGLTNEPTTDSVFWSTVRSYWMKLTCKPSATS